ncbi:MAG TPA: dienelactone hydrolase family protein [Acidimicrobiales bacterium]|nr:dienelactone hydrolase family protein [Acidimicrobiales bacterium]
MSAFPDFDETTATFDGATKTVWRRGRGPAVIVMAEVPGNTPRVADFARRVADRGMTAVMPHLFGTPGKAPSAGYALQTMARACVSREFTMFATGQASPVTVWLRRLAADEHDRCGGPGVGAVGMCLTGGFALAMMVDDTVVAPVLSQPSLPVGLTTGHKRDLGISEADLARVKARAAAGCEVLGLRFTGDRLAPAERFARLREELGDRFVGVELDSSPGNPYGHKPRAHSVLTEDLDDRPGTPTREALDRVLDFFARRLGVA